MSTRPRPLIATLFGGGKEATEFQFKAGQYIFAGERPVSADKFDIEARAISGAADIDAPF